MHVFKGVKYQRGKGLGGILSSLWRRSLPILKQGAKFVGKTLMDIGADTLSDMQQNGNSFKKALKNSAKRKAGDLLTGVGKRMKGQGAGQIKKARSNLIFAKIKTRAIRRKTKRKVKKKKKKKKKSGGGGGGRKSRVTRKKFKKKTKKRKAVKKRKKPRRSTLF